MSGVSDSPFDARSLFASLPPGTRWANGGGSSIGGCNGYHIAPENKQDDAPNRWVDAKCRHCKTSDPCLIHDQRPKTLAQNRVIFGPSFGYEPTAEDHQPAHS